MAMSFNGLNTVYFLLVEIVSRSNFARPLVFYHGNIFILSQVACGEIIAFWIYSFGLTFNRRK